MYAVAGIGIVMAVLGERAVILVTGVLRIDCIDIPVLSSYVSGTV